MCFRILYHLRVLNNLTVYDATYLELALRRRVPLATLEQALAEAAKVEGIKVLPDYPVS